MNKELKACYAIKFIDDDCIIYNAPSIAPIFATIVDYFNDPAIDESLKPQGFDRSKFHLEKIYVSLF